MLNLRIIVNSALLCLCCTPLMGCGQKGPLYLPTAPEAAGRATLPETLLGPLRPGKPASASVRPASAPSHLPGMPHHQTLSDDFMVSPSDTAGY